MPHRAFIGIGSNLGDRKANYLRGDRADSEASQHPHRQAVLALRERAARRRQDVVRQRRRRDRDRVPRRRSAEDASRPSRRPWAASGSRGKRWGSRIIDLDILFFDNEIIDKRNLKVPHPGVPEPPLRPRPLSELAPQMIHPKLSMTVSELLAGIKDTKKIHLLRRVTRCAWSVAPLSPRRRSPWR